MACATQSHAVVGVAVLTGGSWGSAKYYAQSPPRSGRLIAVFASTQSCDVVIKGLFLREVLVG